jgi:RHS repeat-associated protein
VRDVVDDSGTVLNHVVYDAFGGVTSQTNSSVVFRYGYTARELDAESGLQYNRARYLDTFTGKFISEDPISFQGGDSNLYRYVANNSLNSVDPTGNYGRLLYPQVRVIQYTVRNSQTFVQTQKTTGDIQNVINDRLNGNITSITYDFTAAIITFSPVETGKPLTKTPPDSKGSDDKGHIVGKQLGGLNSLNNSFAQDRSTNRSRLRGYEDKVKKYLNPQQPGLCRLNPITLSYSVSLYYNPFSLRPVALSSTAVFSDGHIMATIPLRVPNP